MAFYQEGSALVYQYDAETLRIEPWGENSLRVRASKVAPMPQRDWALTQAVSHSAQVTVGEREASISNGQITATLTAGGWLKFFNAQGKEPQPQGFVRPHLLRPGGGGPGVPAHPQRRVPAHRPV